MTVPMDRKHLRIGHLLRDLRKAAGLSQEDVARTWGCHRTNVSHVESGHQQVSVDNLRAFAELVGKDVGDLVREAA